MIQLNWRKEKESGKLVFKTRPFIIFNILFTLLTLALVIEELLHNSFNYIAISLAILAIFWLIWNPTIDIVIDPQHQTLMATHRWLGFRKSMTVLPFDRMTELKIKKVWLPRGDSIYHLSVRDINGNDVRLHTGMENTIVELAKEISLMTGVHWSYDYY